jgi:hypothetical protein
MNFFERAGLNSVFGSTVATSSTAESTTALDQLLRTADRIRIVAREEFDGGGDALLQLGMADLEDARHLREGVAARERAHEEPPGRREGEA